MNLYETNKLKYISYALAGIVSLILIPLILYIGLKENPDSTEYSCSNLIYSNDKLKQAEEIKVTSARTFNESINASSVFFSMSKSLNLTNDVNTLLSKAKQVEADKNTTTITIPNKACKSSMETGQQDAFTRSTDNSLPNLAIYNWVKTSENYFAAKLNSTNVIMLLDDSAISIEFSGSPNFFFGIKAKITVYSLDLSTNREPSQI
ncbi:hypothetical protein PTQ21_12245 [Paenibacillus marchantiae]|uniref:hypothetical protein n=1 Tax=Paenibacillus marchantiae TaxID=3026433 RepID=UPI00237AD92A|nr:hypothetical protein [Paenibacillus marchantiae]WDQ34960.1 hypothetical protein PTQ21_12245 [Paenibacillus marchantiae]